MEVVQLAEHDRGSTVQVLVGQQVDIALVANPSTGYGWELSELDESVLVLESESLHVDSDLEGAPGVSTFRVVATGSGEVEVRLNYRRPWEEGVEPIDSFVLELVVRNQ